MKIAVYTSTVITQTSEKMYMRLTAIIASGLVVVLALIWLLQKPAYDSAVAFAAALAALFSSFFLKRNRKETTQSQTVSNSSVGVQAGRNVSIRDIKRKK